MIVAEDEDPRCSQLGRQPVVPAEVFSVAVAEEEGSGGPAGRAPVAAVERVAPPVGEAVRDEVRAAGLLHQSPCTHPVNTACDQFPHPHRRCSHYRYLSPRPVAISDAKYKHRRRAERGCRAALPVAGKHKLTRSHHPFICKVYNELIEFNTHHNSLEC